MTGLIFGFGALTTLFGSLHFLLGSAWREIAPSGVESWYGTSTLTTSLAVFFVSAYLFVDARRVSSFLFSSAEDLDFSSSTRGLQAVAISVLGGYFVADALPHLGTNLAMWLWVSRADGALEREGFYVSDTAFDVTFSALQLAVGLALFFRSRWLAGLWGRS